MAGTISESRQRGLVPRPVAFLVVFYGCVAAMSAATIWKILSGVVQRPLIWPVVWCAGSAAAVYGLALLRPWGRTLAMAGFAVMTIMTLTVAGLLAMNGHPWVALLATGGAAIYVIGIRYLSRPQVKTWFTKSVIG